MKTRIALLMMFAALLGVKNASKKAGAGLRFVVSGAEPLPEAVAQDFETTFGAKILEGYGLTETSPASHWSTPQANKPRSVGRGLPGVRTFIGEEAGLAPLESVSLVTAPYVTGGQVLGVLGVIGPTRMAYERVIPVVQAAADVLGAALDAPK